MTTLGDPAYWEVRYRSETEKSLKFELFDWYVPFNHVYPILESVLDLTVSQKVLILGVGRSCIIDVLYSKGFRDVVAIDISETIIHKMQQKYKDHTGMQFLVMDARVLSIFLDKTFTLVFDKGCIDAMFCSTDFIQSSRMAFDEIYRVLKQEGVLISISYATPLSRVPYFRNINWAIDTCPLTHGEGLMMYILTKTDNEELLNKKVIGGESAVAKKASNVVSNMNQTMNKSSTVKSSANSGSMTVTASVDVLASMVAESADVDG